MNNPLLKVLKENDIVLFAPTSMHPLQALPNVIVISRISNLKFSPADNRRKIDWLECKQEVLYCNYRLRPSQLIGIYNMTGATEVILPELLEHTAKIYNLLDTKKYILTEEECKIREEQEEERLKNNLI